MKPTLLILAAGMGSRYGGLKQVDELGPNGEILIEYSIYDAIRAGFGKVVFVIRKDIEEAFKSKVGNKFEDRIRVEYAFQELNTGLEDLEQPPHREKPWGTAHAVLAAADVIHEPFAVINADDYYGTSAFQTMAEFLTQHCSPDHYSMVGYVLRNTLSDHGSVSRGVCEMDDQHNLTDIVERTKVERNNGAVYFQDQAGQKHQLMEDALVSMNFWGFHPHIFETLKKHFLQFVRDHSDQPKAEFFIPLVINHLIRSGEARVEVLISEDQWYGVTYKEDKPMVQEAFSGLTEEGVYPNPLW